MKAANFQSFFILLLVQNFVLFISRDRSNFLEYLLIFIIELTEVKIHIKNFHWLRFALKLLDFELQQRMMIT